MSCYLPLVHRWRQKQKKPANLREAQSQPANSAPTSAEASVQAQGTGTAVPTTVQATRDGRGITLSQGMGDFPHQVFLNIRHDHPTLGLDDVAYQRLHQEHTHQTRPGRGESGGVVSLGLPLGISSLKLTSKPRKVKNRRSNGHMSDGDLEVRKTNRGGRRFPGLAPAPSISMQGTSLPRKTKIPTPYQVQQVRPVSVDADLLLKSRISSAQERDDYLQSGYRSGPERDLRRPPGFRSTARDTEVSLRHSTLGPEAGARFAQLTSTRDFMAGQEAEKSSSGNSSGSDLTWEGSPPPEDLHPALRGRSQTEVVVATRGPPPKHLLPKKLKPSPLTKLHPMVVLTPEIRRELERYQSPEDPVDYQSPDEAVEEDLTVEEEDESSEDEDLRPLPYRKQKHGIRLSRGSPFGGSRHVTPHGSQRRRKNKTPSPLDSGYKTMEHSYDGESSVSSDGQTKERWRSDDRLDAVHRLKVGVTTRDGCEERMSRLAPGVVQQPRRGESVFPCYLLRLSDRQLASVLSYLSSMDLVQLSRTCRRLHKLSWTPSLWNTIRFNDESVDVDRAIRSILVKLVWGAGSGGAPHSSDKSPLGAPGVEAVLLGGCGKLTDRSLALLARNCPQLSHLELQRCRNVTNGGILDLLSRCSKLEHLDLTGCPMISSLNHGRRNEFVSLSYLDLSECLSLDDTGLQMVVTSCPNLTHLYLRKCTGISDFGVKSIASYCPQLRELSVSECSGIGDQGIAELSRLGPSLRYLSVAKCSHVSDAGLRLVWKHCYKLRYLNLRGCANINDSTLQYIAASCARLRSLDVGKCDISDTGLRMLAAKLPQLRKLSVRGCEGVGDGGVAAVARGCSALTQLNVQDVRISVNMIRSLTRNLRHCHIEHSAVMGN